MKTSESDVVLLSSLNSFRLETSELLRVINATIESHKNRRRSDIMLAIATITDFNWSSNKATAILVRLRALAKMAEKNELRHWILADETDFAPTIAHRVLISAAAEHPLSLRDGNFVFEKESFLRKVLQLAEPEGRLQ